MFSWRMRAESGADAVLNGLQVVLLGEEVQWRSISFASMHPAKKWGPVVGILNFGKLELATIAAPTEHYQKHFLG